MSDTTCLYVPGSSERVRLEFPSGTSSRMFGLFKCTYCGRQFRTRIAYVRNGNTKSCGCRFGDASTRRAMISGVRRTKTIWSDMIRRCHDPKNSGYKYYGARGITVCDKWRDSFDAFLHDMGERPEGLSIDRVDNSKGYSPDNCRWATSTEQNRNSRRNRLITAHGKTMTMSEWSYETGLAFDAIRYRLDEGWSEEDAVSIPSGAYWSYHRKMRIESPAGREEVEFSNVEGN